MTLTDTTEVRVIEANADGRDAAEVWRGPLSRLEADNCFDAEEAGKLRSDLETEGRYVTGGGAAPLFIVEVVGQYTVTLFGHAGSALRRFATVEEATAFAVVLVAGHPETLAAVVTDVARGETVWQHNPIRTTQSRAAQRVA